MTYLPNALNVYETYTYNLKLYMIRPEHTPLMEENIKTPGKATLIIDNAGAANYNINNLEQQYVVGHNRVRNTFVNRFTIQVAEPNGVTLLDTIRRSAAAMGIIDHKQAVYILVIEFNGRKADGKASKHPQVFYYPIKITDFQFKVDEGGTNYNITAIENSTAAYNYLNNVIKNQVTILASTVGEFFELFNEVANKAAKEAIVYSLDQLFADTFEITFDDLISDWEQWEFQALTEELTQDNINIISAGAGSGQSKLQITISNGSNLTDIVNIILSQTAEYKQIVLEGGGAARPRPNEEVTSDLSQLPVFHKVVTNVTYGDYDWLRGDYIKDNQYKIVKYIKPEVILSPAQYIGGITDASIQARRVQALKDKGLLRKRYDYIFTGANTEVLDFDIQIDYAYYHTTPYGGGQLGAANITQPTQAGANENVLGNLIDNIKEMKLSISNLERTQRTNQFNVANVRAPEDVGFGNRTNINALKLTIADTTNLINQATEDFREQAAALGIHLQESGMTGSEIAMALRFAQDVISDGDTAGSDNDNTGGHLKFGALVTNLENQADLMSIEIGIRGDPYWLGRPNSFYTATGLHNGDNLADFERGSNGFYLKCALPYPYEDASGRRKPNVEYEISGFYTVIDVITRYTGGKFTMYLNAVRDLGTNTPTVQDELDAQSKDNNREQNSDMGKTSDDPAASAELARIRTETANATRPDA
jgi:hypothetical protein